MFHFKPQAITLGFIVIIALFFFAPNESLYEESDVLNKISVTSVGVITERQLDNTAPIADLHVTMALVKRIGEPYALLKMNSMTRWPLASLTKLMTAVVALEQLGPKRLVTFSEKSIATEGESGGFRIGESFSVRDLISALMIVSSNDAAVALSEAYGPAAFIAAMQTKARTLGMSQTTFTDPAGLSFLNQSTIDDLEKLVVYALQQHPDIFAASRRPTATLTNSRRLKNINEFTKRDDFIGGKTGFTDEANGNLISLFRDPTSDKILLIVVLGTGDRFGQTIRLHEYFTSH